MSGTVLPIENLFEPPERIHFQVLLKGLVLMFLGIKPSYKTSFLRYEREKIVAKSLLIS